MAMGLAVLLATFVATVESSLSQTLQRRSGTRTSVRWKMMGHRMRALLHGHLGGWGAWILKEHWKAVNS